MRKNLIISLAPVNDITNVNYLPLKASILREEFYTFILIYRANLGRYLPLEFSTLPDLKYVCTTKTEITNVITKGKIKLKTLGLRQFFRHYTLRMKIKMKLHSKDSS